MTERIETDFINEPYSEQCHQLKCRLLSFDDTNEIVINAPDAVGRVATSKLALSSSSSEQATPNISPIKENVRVAISNKQANCEVDGTSLKSSGRKQHTTTCLGRTKKRVRNCKLRVQEDKVLGPEFRSRNCKPTKKYLVTNEQMEEMLETEVEMAELNDLIGILLEKSKQKIVNIQHRKARLKQRKERKDQRRRVRLERKQKKEIDKLKREEEEKRIDDKVKTFLASLNKNQK